MPFLRRIRIKNYKSLRDVDVRFEDDLTLIVGPNGCGKSTFLDAIAFFAQAVSETLARAIADRGGIDAIRHAAAAEDEPTVIGVEYIIQSVPKVQRTPFVLGRWEFAVQADEQLGFRVVRDVSREFEPSLHGGTDPEGPEGMTGKWRGVEIRDGVATGFNDPNMRIEVPQDQLRNRFMPFGFRDSLERWFHELQPMTFQPDKLRGPQRAARTSMPKPDGSDILNALRTTLETTPERGALIADYLGAMLGRPVALRVDAISGYLILKLDFVPDNGVGDVRTADAFDQSQLSDGTLRALAILTALFRPADMHLAPTPMVLLEEPELFIHPGAAKVMLDAMKAAAETRQIIAVTHSPDLLDDLDLKPSNILAAEMVDGATRIGPVIEHSRAAIARQLRTPGELLQAGQLTPAPLAEDQAAAE